MASASTADIAALKDAVYNGCFSVWEENGMDPKMSFRQQDIVDLDVIPGDDLNVLLQVVQRLIDEKYFRTVHAPDGVAWMLRTAEDAKRYRGLTAEQEIVYALIDEAASDGAWSKTIKIKTNLHDSIFQSAIKHLKSRNMISEMKSVEHPTRKMYILSSLRPSERATGGPWFTDGELDEEFINTVIKVLFDYIMKRTFYNSKHNVSPVRQAKKVHKKMTTEEIKALRDQGLGARGVKDEEPESEMAAKKRKFDNMLPMPAGYQGYPTLNELTLFVENANIFSQTLAANDIQQLLDIMCYDDRIDRVINGAEGVSYRALRKSLRDEDDHNSLLSEVPCGRCPVFDLCEEGGPVGPSNCEYFNDWLSI
ncbi:RNA polymerase Rpc34 [Rhexocercosporidium sp. MPI-PUGE-AT-0058]|nr:RNA polymerase Rpc34 [Rhexocercosporidium sp. MPI-PUGE-AT-0058]